jgi:hypothetical protein
MNKRKLMYYDLKKNWPKVRRHLQDKELNDILVRDFNKFDKDERRTRETPSRYHTPLVSLRP